MLHLCCYNWLCVIWVFPTDATESSGILIRSRWQRHASCGKLPAENYFSLSAWLFCSGLHKSRPQTPRPHILKSSILFLLPKPSFVVNTALSPYHLVTDSCPQPLSLWPLPREQVSLRSSCMSWEEHQIGVLSRAAHPIPLHT